MGIGDPARRNWVLDEAASRPIVKRCVDLGINLIETCDFYSLGIGEEVIGRLIEDFVPRHEIWRSRPATPWARVRTQGLFAQASERGG